MSSQESDRFVSIAQAAKIYQRLTGRRVHVCTLYRWAQKGFHGVRLPVIYTGGRASTTEANLLQFFRDVTAARTGQQPGCVVEKSSKDRVARAEAELALAGI